MTQIFLSILSTRILRVIKGLNLSHICIRKTDIGPESGIIHHKIVNSIKYNM